VLVVEDDPSLLAVMVECLMREGYRVATAAAGADAVAASRRSDFDAYVIDVFLPDAGGLGVARTLAAQRERAPLPVLFVTAMSLPGVRKALAPAPVLFKPFRRRELVEGIVEAMRRPSSVLGQGPESFAGREA
jgi:DNA-binding response OmpR family regulator